MTEKQENYLSIIYPFIHLSTYLEREEIEAGMPERGNKVSPRTACQGICRAETCSNKTKQNKKSIKLGFCFFLGGGVFAIEILTED